MVAIELHFVTGKYHASPWDADANEGRVEWPPSPWRIARALISSYYERHPELDEAVVRRLAGLLGGTLPAYHLPDAVHTHTRHYMPRVDKTDKTRKTFDAFLRLDRREPLVVTWEDVVLSAEEREVLATLVRDMGYFGRAESLADGRLVDEMTRPVNCRPDMFAPVDDGELEQVLALHPPEQFGQVIEQQAEALRGRWLAEDQEKARSKGKDVPDTLRSALQKKLTAMLPADGFEAAMVTTEDLHSAGLSRPLGTRWVGYRRPPLAFRASGSKAMAQGRWTVALFSVASKLPPKATELLHHTERLHQAITKRIGASALSGVHDDGSARSGHEHAHLLAEPDDHGRLRQFVVWVPAGFGPDDAQALEDIERLWDRKRGHVRVLLTTLGDVEELQGASQFFGTSKVWRSVTPFVATRHPKTTRGGVPKLDTSFTVSCDSEQVSLQRGGPAHDCLRLLGLRGAPPVVRIDNLDAVDFGVVETSWRTFHTSRNLGGGRRGPGPGCGFEIEFAEEVAGPMVVGYGAHFGLGVFAPA